MQSYSLNKNKIKFLLLEGIHEEASRVLRANGYENIELHKGSLTGADLRKALQNAHFVGIRSRTQLDREILTQAKLLNAIGCFCIGTNQVDLHAAEDLGIPVFNAPFSNTRSVAELAIAEIVMLMRGIPQKNAAAHRGEWLKSAAGAHEIRGKTLGIIGYGHIGSQLGILAENLGMQVIFYDIENKLPLGNAAATESLQPLLRKSDAISLHVPETPATQHLIDAETLAAMQPGVFIVNASRGQVIDIDALTQALQSGHVGGAAVDVFPLEPKSNQHQFQSPLRGMDNVILTPHIGGSTEEAQQNIAREVAEKLAKYSDNGSTLSAVNFPQVSIPDQRETRRILHIHHNAPGILQKINAVISSEEVNIAAQYLQTTANIGYVVMDIEAQDAAQLVAKLKAIEETIRCRLLH